MRGVLWCATAALGAAASDATLWPVSTRRFETPGQGPELAAALRARKLSNCGVAAVELDFSAPSGAPLIAGVQLLFGTRLVP